jgi:hypothetical protein
VSFTLKIQKGYKRKNCSKRVRQEKQKNTGAKQSSIGKSRQNQKKKDAQNCVQYVIMTSSLIYTLRILVLRYASCFAPRLARPGSLRSLLKFAPSKFFRFVAAFASNAHVRLYTFRLLARRRRAEIPNCSDLLVPTLKTCFRLVY